MDTAKTEKAAIEVKVLWKGAPVEVREFDDPEAVTIGSTPRCDLYLMPEGLSHAEFPIVRKSNGESVLTFTDDMEGEIRLPERTVSIPELVAYGEAEPDPILYRSYRHPLPIGAEAEVRLSHMTLVLRCVPARKRLPRGIFKSVDQSIVNASLATFFAAATLVASFALFPFDLATTGEAAVRQSRPWTIMGPPSVRPPEKVPAQAFVPAGQSKSAASVGEKGLAGKKNELNKEGRIAFAPRRENPRDAMARIGVLAFLKDRGLVFPVGRLATPDALKDALGHLHGRDYADADGLGGLSDRGAGPGGGGETLNSIGIDRIGIPGVPGEGDEGRAGPPVTRLAAKIETEIPPVDGGAPTIVGGIDKELVRRVIRMHRNDVRFCYERALVSKPGLWGKVAVAFVVGAGGKVLTSNIKESTAADSDLETCIAAKVRSWTFPEPKGGGEVYVTYPFVLRRT